MIELPQGRPAPGSCPPQQKLTALVPPEISRKTRTCAGGFHSCGSRFHQIYPTVCKSMAVWSGSFLKFELATLGIVYIRRICAPDTRLSKICSVPCWWSNLDRSLFQCLRERRNPLSQFRLSQHSHEHQNGGPCGQQPVDPSLFLSRTHGARKSFFLVCR